MTDYGRIQNTMSSGYAPSSASLLSMIERAEAKFAESRRRALNERGERIAAMNARKFREEREHNARRYVNAGDRP
jgi:hypothetical protein